MYASTNYNNMKLIHVFCVTVRCLGGYPIQAVFMMGLSDGKRISMISSTVLIRRTRVTDGRTDRRNCRGIYA